MVWGGTGAWKKTQTRYILGKNNVKKREVRSEFGVTNVLAKRNVNGETE